MTRWSMLLIATALPLLAAGDARLLQVRAEVLCRGGVLRLGDVIANDDALDRQERDLQLADTLPPNRQLSLVRLAYLMQQHEQLRDVQLRGPRWIRLRRVADQELLDRAHAAVLAHLHGNNPWQDWTIDVAFSADDDRLLARVGPFDQVRVMPCDDRQALGVIRLRLTFFDAAGSALCDLFIMPTVRRQVQAVVLRQPRPRGHVLGAADLDTASIWIADDEAIFVTDAAGCLGRELARELGAGKLLSHGLLLEPLCAQRGDRVWVAATVGSLVVRLPARALESGRRGDCIRVLNERSQRELRVTLAGDKYADLETGTTP